MIPDEERWDDLEIEENSFMYRTTRGIYSSCYPDKEVAMLCQRVLSPSYSDDDDTISTTTSHHSDKFSVDEQDYFLSDISSLMASASSLSLNGNNKPKISTIRKQQQSSSSSPSDNTFLSDLLKGYDGPGKITRLGQPGGGRVQKDFGDWTHDIEIPNNEPFQKKIKQPNNNNNNNIDKYDDDDFLLFNDDILDNDPFISNHPLTHENSVKQKRVRFGFEVDDDHDVQNKNKRNNNNTNNNDDTNKKLNSTTNTPLNNQEQKSLLTTKVKTTTMHQHQQQWFEESDNEGFDDICLPDDMNTLSIKNRLNNKTRSTICNNNNVNNYNINTHLNNNKKEKEKSCQIPVHLEKIQIYKENDHDDFINGLDVVNDEIFKFGNISKKMKQQQQHQQQIESKLPRLRKAHQQSYIPFSSSSSSFSLSSSSTASHNKRSVYENKLQRLTAPTYSSRQRTITNNNNNNNNITSTSLNNNNNILSLRTRKSDLNLRKEFNSLTTSIPHPTPYRSLIKNNQSLSTPISRPNFLQKNKQPLTRKKTSLSSDTTAPRSIHTLMTRPRGSRYTNYGNGTELDNLDDLAVWKKSNVYYSRTSTNLHKKQDNSKPWRQNMSKRTLKLIKPDDKALTSEINGMKYDSKNKRWKGNEQAVRSFEETTPKKRPALIKNMMSSKSTSSKYSKAVSVNEMIFDQEEMKWNSSNGDEIDIFAHISDLLDDTINDKSKNYSISLANRRRPSTIPMSSSSLSSSSSIHKQHMMNYHHPTNTSNQLGNQNTNPYDSYYNQLSNVPIFYIPNEMKHHMRELEAEHNNLFNPWPLYEESDTIKNQFGHIVPQYTYILY